MITQQQEEQHRHNAKMMSLTSQTSRCNNQRCRNTQQSESIMRSPVLVILLIILAKLIILAVPKVGDDLANREMQHKKEAERDAIALAIKH